MEEIDVKKIKQNKKLIEKQEKENEKNNKKIENKTIRIKKNTVLNKNQTPASSTPKPQIIPFREYKDGLISMYYDIISKMATKYIKNVNEISLKQKFVFSNDLNSILNYLLDYEIQNPLLLLIITTVSHITQDSVSNQLKKDIQQKFEKEINENTHSGGLDIKEEKND